MSFFVRARTLRAPARSSSIIESASLRSALLALMLLAALLPGCGASPASDDDYEDEEAESDGGRATSRTDAGSRPGSNVRDAGSTPAVRGDAAAAPSPLAPGDRTPSKDNIKECPPVAPENPIGSCLGVPIYATCSYTTYNCICDWYHWICI